MAHPGFDFDRRRQLRDAALARSTLGYYQKAVSHFLNWYKVGKPLLPTIRCSDDADYVVSLYISDVHQVGGSRQQVMNARYGLRHYLPRKFTVLPYSDRMIKGWSRLTPSNSRLPLPWSVVVNMAGMLASEGMLRVAVGVLLAFECYLRINELLHLRVSDIFLPGDVSNALHGVSDQGSLRLRFTKTGRDKYVTIRSKEIMQLLKHVRRGLGPDDSLCGVKESMFRSLFKKVLDALDLKHLNFTPHSLRHGGATHDSLQDCSVDYIMERGRWAPNSPSAVRYMQSGRAIMSSTHIPLHISQTYDVLCKDLVRTLVRLSRDKSQ